MYLTELNLTVTEDPVANALRRRRGRHEEGGDRAVAAEARLQGGLPAARRQVERRPGRPRGRRISETATARRGRALREEGEDKEIVRSGV